jgi:hypothetical protein
MEVQIGPLGDQVVGELNVNDVPRLDAQQRAAKAGNRVGCIRAVERQARVNDDRPAVVILRFVVRQLAQGHGATVHIVGVLDRGHLNIEPAVGAAELGEALPVYGVANDKRLERVGREERTEGQDEGTEE